MASLFTEPAPGSQQWKPSASEQALNYINMLRNSVGDFFTGPMYSTPEADPMNRLQKQAGKLRDQLLDMPRQFAQHPENFIGPGEIGMALPKGFNPEMIKSAAIRVNGKHVIEAPNHFQAAEIGEPLHGSDAWDGEQGFTTTHGRFVDRAEAADIARNAEQYAGQSPELESGHLGHDQSALLTPEMQTMIDSLSSAERAQYSEMTSSRDTPMRALRRLGKMPSR